MTTATSYYSSYGLTIQSEIELPELLSAEESPCDVKIQFGSVPSELSNAQARGVAWQAAPNQMLLDVRNVARYWVTDGETITIEPAEDRCEEEDFRAFLFGSVWGALLHQRGFLTLHASAIATQNGAVLFSGKSGAGKSTLAAAMEQRGYALLSDDKTAITFDSLGQPIAVPAYPTRRLWLDSAEQLGKTVDGAQRLRAGLNKYVSRADDFCTEAQPVRTIFVLKVHNQATVELDECTGADSLAALIKCAYRKKMLYGFGGRSAQFHLTSALANSVRTINVRRPAAPFMLDKLATLVQEVIS